MEGVLGRVDDGNLLHKRVKGSYIPIDSFVSWRDIFI
jgi:hypothetical protein